MRLCQKRMLGHANRGTDSLMGCRARAIMQWKKRTRHVHVREVDLLERRQPRDVGDGAPRLARARPGAAAAAADARGVERDDAAAVARKARLRRRAVLTRHALRPGVGRVGGVPTQNRPPDLLQRRVVRRARAPVRPRQSERERVGRAVAGRHPARRVLVVRHRLAAVPAREAEVGAARVEARQPGRHLAADAAARERQALQARELRPPLVRDGRGVERLGVVQVERAHARREVGVVVRHAVEAGAVQVDVENGRAQQACYNSLGEREREGVRQCHKGRGKQIKWPCDGFRVQARTRSDTHERAHTPGARAAHCLGCCPGARGCSRGRAP